MKQLEMFFDKLRNAGYSVTTNWQVDLPRNGYVEHVIIQSDRGMLFAMFQVFGENEGYQMYIETRGETFEDDLETINGIID